VGDRNLFAGWCRLRVGPFWTTFVTFPLVVSIQIVSARIGRVTGHGLAANIRKHYIPRRCFTGSSGRR
jgi:hypothetical protein